MGLHRCDTTSLLADKGLAKNPPGIPQSEAPVPLHCQNGPRESASDIFRRTRAEGELSRPVPFSYCGLGSQALRSALER
jgi:hypothetical protein